MENNFPKVTDIYNNYLDKQQEINQKKYREGRPEGYFTASGAGKCFKQNYYQLLGTDMRELDVRVKSLLRLGTLVHIDLEEAFKNIHIPDYLCMTEHDIKLSDLKVIGRADLVIFNIESGHLRVYDYKTAASYKWRLKFGLKKNRDKNPSKQYELQLGTYALGIRKELEKRVDVKDTELRIVWYNKDTSAMKEEIIDTNFMVLAEAYWEDLNEAVDDIKSVDELIPYETYGVPMMDWECRYCAFNEKCKPTKGGVAI
tara:strand:- start:565 stop:1335 length:771 start_codon:yes stop_codon:yes gene_type:complete